MTLHQDKIHDDGPTPAAIRYRRLKAAGICTHCGKEDATHGTRCGGCCMMYRDIDAERRARNKKAGKCNKCYKLKTECICTSQPRVRYTEVHRERARVRARIKWRTERAIKSLMRGLYGACWPRPHCDNSCQSPQFDRGTPGIWYRQKYCVTCAVLTWDYVCMCCRHKTENIHNRTAYIRERWKIAQAVEDGTMPIIPPEPEPESEPTPPPKQFCYFCGQESRQIVCKSCEGKAEAAGATEYGEDETGSDKAFYRRHRPASKMMGGVKRAGHEVPGHFHNDITERNVDPAKLEKNTSRRAAISKRNAYASPPPTSEGLKDADKKYDAIARAKERKERKPSEVVEEVL